MEWNKAFQRVWRTWKYGFLIAIIVYFCVFWWGYNYEVHREEEPIYSEEPLPLFHVSVSPSISPGIKVYTVNVTNNNLYIIKELVIEFQGTRLTKPDDFFETYDDTVGVGGEVSYLNNVFEGAQNIDIILEGQEVVGGRTDINLYLQSMNTSTIWEDTSLGNHQEIHLTQDDIRNGGFGEYQTSVRHEGGFRAVPFQLTYRIIYSEIITSRTSIEPIEPDESIELEFILNIDDRQLEDIVCSINSKVKLSEDMTLPLGMEYDYNWNLISSKQPIPQELAEEIPWGPVDMTGTSSAVLYTLTIIGGFGVYLRVRLKGIATPKLIRKGHCFIALITLMFESAHISIALQKEWPWLTPGLLFGYGGIGLLGLFVIVSFFDVELIQDIGREKWRKLHLGITFMLMILILLHLGLMGDHLGFLKGFF